MVLAIASEAERKNQNLLGRKILRLLRKSALDAFKVKNPSPRYFEFPWRGFSWVEEEAIETARASMALPITGGSILVLALVSLNFFHRTFSRSKDDQASCSTQDEGIPLTLVLLQLFILTSSDICL